MLSPFIITISIFILFIAFNIYIRVRTFGYYRQLVQRRIQFNFKDLFSKTRWLNIKSTYPEDHALLDTFRKHMLTTGMLFVLIIVIVIALLTVMRLQSM